MRNLSRSNTNIGLNLVFIILLSTPPFVFELFPHVPGWKVLYMLFFPILFIFTYINKVKIISSYCVHFLIYWVLSWFLFAIVHGDSVYVSRIIVAFISIIIVSIICNIGIEEFCRRYVKLITVFSFLGALTFVLVYTVGISPVFEYENADTRPGFCFLLTCTNSYTAANGTIRFSGFFDEPGAMGLWGTVALLINKLTINNKRYEIILLLTLCFTFSLGYYITFVLYLLFFMVNRKNWGYFLLLLIILSVLGYFLLQNEFIYQMTASRFVYDDSTGTIAGNNRMENQIMAKEYFMKYPVFGVGASNTEALENSGVFIGDNILSPLAKDGILGVLVIYFPFVYTIFKYRRNTVILKSLIIYAFTFYHRSISFTTFNIVMYLVLLLSARLNYSRTTNLNFK